MMWVEISLLAVFLLMVGYYAGMAHAEALLRREARRRRW